MLSSRDSIALCIQYASRYYTSQQILRCGVMGKGWWGWVRVLSIAIQEHICRHICIYVSIYGSIYARMLICWHCIYACVYVSIYGDIYAYIRMHVCWHNCKYACIDASIYAYMVTPWQTYMPVCLYPGIYAYMHAYMFKHIWKHICIYAYILAYMHMCMHACIYGGISACMLAYMHSCNHICSTSKCEESFGYVGGWECNEIILGWLCVGVTRAHARDERTASQTHGNPYSCGEGDPGE